MSDIKLSREELFLYPQMYLFYRQYPVLAARDILGLKLPPHQRLDLRLQWHTKAVDMIRIFSRGMSKTFGEALYGILSAILHPRLRILAIGAGGFRQGKLILEEAEKIIKGDCDGQIRDNFVYNMIDSSQRRSSSSVIKKDPDLWKIPFKNGSVIATAPVGTSGDAIRGFRANVVQIDERKDLKKEIKERVIKPFGIVDYNVVSEQSEYDNKNIDSGTLQYEEDDYTKELEEYKRLIKNGSEDHLVIKFVYADAFDTAKQGEDYAYFSEWFQERLKFWSVPYKIKVDDIERELDKITTDIESWRAEYLCEPMRATGDYYSFDLIKGAINKLVINDVKFMELENSDGVTQYLRPRVTCDDPCILGVDCAREHDMTAFSIMRVGPMSEKDWDPISQEGKTQFCNIVWAYAAYNMHDEDAAILIYQLLDKFNIKIVALDKRGGGSGVRDQLYHVVHDGKVVDEKGNPKEVEVLFDPSDDDEGGIATLLRGSKKEMLSGNDRLRLLTYTDEDNTTVNRSIRNAMGSNIFYFAAGDEMIETGGDIDEINMLKSTMDFINAIPRQFRMIETKPTKHWLQFAVPNPENNHKDLYSATIYAWGEVMKVITDHLKPKKKHRATIAPTMNLKLRGRHV
jgi:hypothetical protein